MGAKVSLMTEGHEDGKEISGSFEAYPAYTGR